MQCIVRGFFNRIKWDDSGQLMVAMHCAVIGNYGLRCGQQAIVTIGGKTAGVHVYGQTDGVQAYG